MKSPDQRSCPPWCWVSGSRYGHEITASLYPAAPASQMTPGVTMATLEPALEQRGQKAPTIRVGFRRYEGREQHYEDDFLRLSIDDAEDLIAALSYPVRTAEQG